MLFWKKITRWLTHLRQTNTAGEKKQVLRRLCSNEKDVAESEGSAVIQCATFAKKNPRRPGPPASRWAAPHYMSTRAPLTFIHRPVTILHRAGDLSGRQGCGRTLGALQRRREQRPWGSLAFAFFPSEWLKVWQQAPTMIKQSLPWKFQHKQDRHLQK